jgi:hypothetical protein
MRIVSLLVFLFIVIPLSVISTIAVIAGIYLSVFNHDSFNIIIGRMFVVVGSGGLISAGKLIKRV